MLLNFLFFLCDVIHFSVSSFHLRFLSSQMTSACSYYSFTYFNLLCVLGGHSVHEKLRGQFLVIRASVLFCHLVGSKDQTQVFSPAPKFLYQLSFVGPHVIHSFMFY